MGEWPTATCCCGAAIEKAGSQWRHVETKDIWCYAEEEGMDEESRCDAMPDDAALREEE